MKKVMVFGTFDVLHKGHLYFLNEAKKHGNYLVVVVARDNTVERIKGNKPRNDEFYRKKAVENIGLVDKVLLGEKELSFKPILDEKPDVICLGYDQDSQYVERKFTKIVFIRIGSFESDKYKSSKIK